MVSGAELGGVLAGPQNGTVISTLSATLETYLRLWFENRLGRGDDIQIRGPNPPGGAARVGEVVRAVGSLSILALATGKAERSDLASVDGCRFAQSVALLNVSVRCKQEEVLAGLVRCTFGSIVPCGAGWGVAGSLGRAAESNAD